MAAIRYEKDEYVYVPADKQEARIIRVLENGDDPIYELVFESTGWHKIVNVSEIQKGNPEGAAARRLAREKKSK